VNRIEGILGTLGGNVLMQVIEEVIERLPKETEVKAGVLTLGERKIDFIDDEKDNTASVEKKDKSSF